MTCPALPSRGEEKAESVLEHYNSPSVHRARPRQTCRNYGRMKLKMWEVQFNHGGVSGPGWLLPSCILSWVGQEDEKERGKKVSPPFTPSPRPSRGSPSPTCAECLLHPHSTERLACLVLSLQGAQLVGIEGDAQEGRHDEACSETLDAGPGARGPGERGSVSRSGSPGCAWTGWSAQV